MQNKIAFIWTKNAVMANALNCMHRLENNWLYSQNKFPTINSTLKQKITSLNDNFKKIALNTSVIVGIRWINSQPRPKLPISGCSISLCPLIAVQ